jgi:hypothetical protein
VLLARPGQARGYAANEQLQVAVVGVATLVELTVERKRSTQMPQR